LWVSERPAVVRLVRSSGLGRRLAARFVAGDDVSSAVRAVQELNAAGVAATLDVLGESVTSAAEARAARDAYLETLDAIARAHAASHVSLKLTQLGLDVSEERCVSNVEAVIERARALGSFVRIDMEGSAYTERTLALFRDRFRPEFGTAVGVVLQSYLRRTEHDLTDLLRVGARIRLCKGAYQEPATVAFPRKSDVDANYVRCMERLLKEGREPAIATHDEALIEHAKAFARREGLPPERFEFQMLYGVRRDLQRALRRDGYRVRVYVPFGGAWYRYLVRRLAERPANLWFVAGNVLREALSRRSVDHRA